MPFRCEVCQRTDDLHALDAPNMCRRCHDRACYEGATKGCERPFDKPPLPWSIPEKPEMPKKAPVPILKNAPAPVLKIWTKMFKAPICACYVKVMLEEAPTPAGIQMLYETPEQQNPKATLPALLGVSGADTGELKAYAKLLWKLNLIEKEYDDTGVRRNLAGEVISVDQDEEDEELSLSEDEEEGDKEDQLKKSKEKLKRNEEKLKRTVARMEALTELEKRREEAEEIKTSPRMIAAEQGAITKIQALFRGRKTRWEFGDPQNFSEVAAGGEEMVVRVEEPTLKKQKSTAKKSTAKKSTVEKTIATKKPTKKKVTPNSQKISPHFIDLFTKSLDTFFDEEGGDLAEELTDYIQHDLLTSLKISLKSAMLTAGEKGKIFPNFVKSMGALTNISRTNEQKIQKIIIDDLISSMVTDIKEGKLQIKLSIV